MKNKSRIENITDIFSVVTGNEYSGSNVISEQIKLDPELADKYSEMYDEEIFIESNDGNSDNDKRYSATEKGKKSLFLIKKIKSGLIHIARSGRGLKWGKKKVINYSNN